MFLNISNMYKLNCVLVNSVNNACRLLTASLNASGSSLRGGNVLQRTLCITAVRLQETAASTTGRNTKETSRDFSIFPPMPGEQSSLRWGGKIFEELPIVHIKATYNNTHIQVTDSTGQSLIRASCGTEGFKKSTPTSSQAVGIAAAAKATVKGVTFVRVVVKGLGPGRQTAIKGLVMGGLEVVSITDNTPVPHNGCRPRKAKRL